jgi:alpha-beta hydrolase superfamily lysophospholipase
MPTIKTRDGLDLSLYHFPQPNARGRVVVVHGYNEHAMRYEELARTLNGAGFDVLLYDMRGHGRSGGRRAYIDRFSQYLDDLDLVLSESDRIASTLPRFVIGHSVGGLVTTTHAIDRRPVHAGVVLSAPFFKMKLEVPGWKVLAAKAASSIYPPLSLPSGLSGAVCARDPELAAKYDTDPLNNNAATARWFTESMAAQDRVFHEAAAFELPVLLMHGDKDVVADPARSAEVFPRLGSHDKTLELVPGAFHEIYNEPPDVRKRLMARTAEWLGAHLGAPSA